MIWGTGELFFLVVGGVLRELRKCDGDAIFLVIGMSVSGEALEWQQGAGEVHPGLWDRT